MLTRTALTLAALVFAMPTSARAIDLRITDSRGAEVVVTNAVIDYGGLLGPELESKGIRVQQGDGTVFLKWDDVASIRFLPDTGAKPKYTKLEVTLTNGRRVAADLVRKGKMVLTGKTDLGEYSIDFDKVRAITPIR